MNLVLSAHRLSPSALRVARAQATRNGNLAKMWATDSSIYDATGWTDIQPDAAARHTRLAAHYAHMVLSHLEAISQQQIVRGADDESC